MSTRKARSVVHAAELALYDKLVETNPEVDRKGVRVPYTSLNDHMFSFFSSGSPAIPLPEKQREALLKKYDAKLIKAYGMVMKEYVTVPAGLLRNTVGKAFRCQPRVCEDSQTKTQA